MAFYFIHTEIYTVKSVLLFVSLIGRKMYFHSREEFESDLCLSATSDFLLFS